MLTTVHLIPQAVAMIQAMQIDADIKAVFTSVSNGGYDAIMEKVLADYFGDRELIFDTAAVNEAQIASYLLTRWVYIRQALEYQDAEYNPVENYLNNEREVTTFNSDEKIETTDHDMKQRQIDETYNKDNDRIITFDHNSDGNKVTEFAEGSRSETSSTAPYDSDTFHNNSKMVKEMGSGAKDVTTEKPFQDQETHSEYTNQRIEGAHKDQDKTTRNPYTDETIRVMTRSGNIGTMTAATMIESDSNLWRNFDWLKELAHGIAVTITRGVWLL